MTLYRSTLPFAVILALLWTSARAEDRIPAPARATHPMDALTADEITAATKILRGAGKLGGNALVVSMTVEEPAKAEVRNWTSGKPLARRAFAVVLTEGKLAEAAVDLDTQTLSAWSVIENRQAAITIDEIISVGNILGSDERWRAAMEKRGITNLATVFCFPFSTGPAPDPSRRLLNSSCIDRTDASNNLWGKPIENLMATVDLAAGKVVSITDLGVLPLPPDRQATRGGIRGRPAPSPDPSRSPRRKAPTSRSRAGRCAGTIGRSMFGSIRALARCCR